ncbi:hypothetical protein L873DRAFT_1815466 [Choiromyces venosus 120613-1]|uniref:Uncharacterized protein n=1 Tax=Choiromyces venosus 120613-1 TaxID=1336337 RepID=A0A3N4J609_9PEZI|nr:hypothetical protein L873DRAFT_1815466 [Choiromyces venosus 120613-1]
MIPIVYHRRADKTEFNNLSIPGKAPGALGIIKHEPHSAMRKIAAHPVLLLPCC